MARAKHHQNPSNICVTAVVHEETHFFDQTESLSYEIKITVQYDYSKNKKSS